MKRIVSLLLAGVMMVSAVPVTYAADTQDYSLGTQVTYTAANNESYFITVPAKLNPGQSGTVTLDGIWPSDKTISVTAEPTVTLTNSILASDQKVLDITFLGISEAGNDTAAQTFTETVSVEDIENALFGTWSGKFNYNVDTSDALTSTTASGSYVVVNDVSPSQHDLSVNLSSDTITDFSSVNVTRYGSNLLDISQLLGSNLVDNGDGTYTFTKTGESREACYSNYQDIFIPKETVIYAAVNPIEVALTQKCLYIVCVFEDNTTELKPLITQANSTTYLPIDTPFVFDKNIVKIGLMCTTTKNLVGDYIVFSEPQVNVGGRYEYQDYTEPQTVVAQADGTVNGLTSVSPNMTIICNNADVQISCDYLKKN